MANDGLITSFLGQGLAASRQAAPTIASDAIAFWWSTDTNELSAWVEGAWIEDILGGAAPSLDLDDLTDVTITTPATGAVLRYNGTVWIDDLLELDDLDDVDTTGKADGDVLTWDAGASDWIAAPPTGGGGGGSGSLIKLAEVIAEGGEATLTISDIVQDFDDLVVVLSVRSDAGSETVCRMTINGDTGANYSWKRTGSGVTEAEDLDTAITVCSGYSGSLLADTFVPGSIEIMEYASSEKTKAGVGQEFVPISMTASQLFALATGFIWNDVSAISTLDFSLASGDFVAGSSIVVYGRGGAVISSGGGGAVLIDSHTTGAAETTVNFTSIPNTYRELKLIVRAGSTKSAGGASDVLLAQFNGDTGSRYVYNRHGWYATTAFADSSTGGTSINAAALASTGLSQRVTTSEIIIPSYAESIDAHTLLARGSTFQNDITSFSWNVGGIWFPTAADVIDEINLSISANAFSTGSEFELWGIS